MKVTSLKLMSGGLGALVGMGALSLTLSACSDDAKVNPGVTPEAGVPETGMPETGMPETGMPETGMPETGMPETGMPEAGRPETSTPSAPRISLVHGSAALGALRFCVSSNKGASLSPSMDKQLPDPTKAPNGFPFGAGSSLTADPTIAAVAVGLPVIDLFVFAVPVALDPTGTKKCSEFWESEKDAPKVAGVVPLTTIPKGTFASGKAYVVAAVGCPANTQSTSDAGTVQTMCGASYDAAKGNLRLIVTEIDEKPAAADQIGFQFLHLSPQGAAAVKAASAGATDKVQAAVNIPGADGGGLAFTVGSPATFADSTGPVASGLVGTTVANSDIATAKAKATLQLHVGAAGGPGILPGAGLAFPLISQLSTGVADATADYFKTGKVYTFVALGDPTVQFAPGNTGFRVIALTN